MEVDPEVAALLDDIPPARLPDVLVREGWGHMSMAQADAWGVGTRKRSAAPGSEQPVYREHCVQCGRPITASRGNHWMDHAGDKICDGLLIDGERLADHHVTASELDFLKGMAARTPPVRTEPGSRTKKVRTVNCSSTKHSHGCPHQCSQKDGHFGFHECMTCRHLWR